MSIGNFDAGSSRELLYGKDGSRTDDPWGPIPLWSQFQPKSSGNCGQHCCYKTEFQIDHHFRIVASCSFADLCPAFVRSKSIDSEFWTVPRNLHSRPMNLRTNIAWLVKGPSVPSHRSDRVPEALQEQRGYAFRILLQWPSLITPATKWKTHWT